MARNHWSAEATHTLTPTNNADVGGYARLASNNIELWRSAVQSDKTSHVEPCTTFLSWRSRFRDTCHRKWGYNDKAPCFVYSGNTVHSTDDLRVVTECRLTDTAKCKWIHTTLSCSTSTTRLYVSTTADRLKERETYPAMTLFNASRRRTLWTPANADAITASEEQEQWSRCHNCIWITRTIETLVQYWARIGWISDRVPRSVLVNQLDPYGFSRNEHVSRLSSWTTILRITTKRPCFYHFIPCVIWRWHVSVTFSAYFNKQSHYGLLVQEFIFTLYELTVWTANIY